MEIKDSDLNEVKELMNSAIRNLLYGGSGDPGWLELTGAAACYKTLKLLNLKVIDEKDIVETLKEQNVYNSNFIDDDDGQRS